MRKIFSVLLILIFTALIFSCQKELYFDDFPTSEGSLKEDAAGLYCLPSTVYGVYKKDSALGNANYIEVDVNVTKTGNYTIISVPNDGMSFSAQGSFANTGVNRVKLLGTGTPLTSGMHQIEIDYNSTSCIVDLDVQAPAPVQNAVFNLGGAPGNCSGFVLAGNFNTGMAMNNGNTATVSITTITPGIYTVTSDTVNGVYFNAAGTLTSSSNNIVLSGNGTPTSTGTFNYSVHSSTGDCSFSITYIGPSTFTVSGAPGTCTGVIAQGIYTSGISTDNTNYVTVSVDVSNTGYYMISTDTVNGIYFSATGSFATTGVQPVTLYANGTPLNASPYPFDYHLYNSNGANNCSFSLTVLGDYMVCEVDGQRVFFNMGTNSLDPTASATLIAISGFPILSIKGYSLLGNPYPSFNIKLNNASNTIGVGTYTTLSVPSNGFLTCDYLDGLNNNYVIAPNPNATTPAFTLNITSTQVRYQGTFSGILQNASGTGIVTITNGVFDIPFR